MAEWSKAADSSSVIFGCVGSNPTSSRGASTQIVVLWCNWLSLWTLNPTIRVQIPVGPGSGCISDTLAEWLRRWPAKPLCSARAGSNPAGVATFHMFLSFRLSLLVNESLLSLSLSPVSESFRSIPYERFSVMSRCHHNSIKLTRIIHN